MSNSTTKQPLRVAIAGLGAIGKSIASALAKGSVPGVVLTAVSAKNHDKAQQFVSGLGVPVKVLTLAELEPVAAVVFFDSER